MIKLEAFFPSAGSRVFEMATFPTIADIPKGARMLHIWPTTVGSIGEEHAAALLKLRETGRLIDMPEGAEIATPANLASYVVVLTDAYNKGLIKVDTFLIAVNDLVSGVK
jgi:hypothetical protein